METRRGSARTESFSCPQLQEAVLVVMWQQSAREPVSGAQGSGWPGCAAGAHGPMLEECTADLRSGQSAPPLQSRLSAGSGPIAWDDPEHSPTDLLLNMAHLHDPLEGIGGDGTIVTGARHARIAVDFRPVLERAIERLKRAGGAPSLYVYGSVATGMARVGRSDVDLVTIGLDAGTAQKLATELSAEYQGLCRSVEIGPAQWSDYGGLGDEAYGNRVFLRHYCVHLAGPDVAITLPTCAADHAAARGFNGDIHLLANRWRAELAGSDPALLGRRIARKTLFAVAGLVSIHDGTWSTDRVSAARRWAEIKPGWAAELATLVAWGDGLPPRPTAPDIQRALQSITADVVDEFRARIGLWRGDAEVTAGDASGSS